MFQFCDFQIPGERTPFDGAALLKQARATLIEAAEYDAAAVAHELSIATLDACRFVAAFSIGNGASNPVHFLKAKRGSLVSSLWRFSIQSLDESQEQPEASNAAA